jgi:hypothetical protein
MPATKNPARVESIGVVFSVAGQTTEAVLRAAQDAPDDQLRACVKALVARYDARAARRERKAEKEAA